MDLEGGEVTGRGRGLGKANPNCKPQTTAGPHAAPPGDGVAAAPLTAVGTIASPLTGRRSGVTAPAVP